MPRIWRRRLNRLRYLWPILFIAVGTTVLILYGRGYRPNLTETDIIKPTGLLSTTSDPIGAQVYVDGKLKTATDNSINVDPGWYLVKMVKEGYIPWEKKLRVQGEVVSRADAFLFPSNPSLSPITNSGIENPLLSPDGTKIAYTIPLSANSGDGLSATKGGLWVYELVDRPLGLNRDPRQLGISATLIDFSKSKLVWSPDSSQLLVIFENNIRLYQTNRAGDFQNVTSTVNTLLKDWETTKRTKILQQLAAFKQPIVDVATSSTQIIAFSPDETKLLYEATKSATLPPIIVPPLIGTNPTEEKRQIEPGKIYVYDSREDKNFFVLDKKELPQLKTPSPTTSPLPRRLPSPSPSNNLQLTTYNLQPIHWFPTSRHLVLTLPGKIDILEYDRTNWVTVYAGPFTDGFLSIWPNTSRIIVLSNLNPSISKLPNLYTVNLR